MRICVLLSAIFLCASCSNSSSSSDNTQRGTPGPTATPTPKQTVLLDKAQVTSHATYSRMDFPPSNAIDGNTNTFVTTNNLSHGEVYILSYAFQNAVDLDYVEIFDNQTNQYCLGDLEVQVSGDSTNGTNGTWESIKSMTMASTDFVSGDGTVQVDRTNIKWLRLKMTFNGTGAFGGSPAFYMSEINFYHLIDL